MRQKDGIEQFVEENRNAFEGEGPDARVWQRLQERLADEGRRPKIRRFPARRWSSVAAILVLCLSMAAFVRTFQISGQKINASIPADLRTAQAFYQNQINLQIDRIKSITANNGGDTALLQNFTGPDQEYRHLTEALRENPGDPHVRAAFVEYYRSRLAVLNRIEGHLSQKTESDESAESSPIR
jgi:hypothetical protein